MMKIIATPAMTPPIIAEVWFDNGLVEVESPAEEPVDDTVPSVVKVIIMSMLDFGDPPESFFEVVDGGVVAVGLDPDIVDKVGLGRTVTSVEKNVLPFCILTAMIWKRPC